MGLIDSDGMMNVNRFDPAAGYKRPCESSGIAC